MYGAEYLREFEFPSGPRLLPDAFDCILARQKYCTELTNLSTLSVFEVEIWCYRGSNRIPQWIYATQNGKTYWTIMFSVEIHFGLTEFKDALVFRKNNVDRLGGLADFWP
ncbi:hypothetical protein EV702DRAFT_1246716 [Suillus placidus]|uniref:Uncharacterized protein n=1 Tax=Suillus placidus TaxID=48579 RepID=A0A9P6ZMV2_9AGAM|nr:hypothetical protein EV702DRAFT_1246716 [Suillus placidus]